MVAHPKPKYTATREPQAERVSAFLKARDAWRFTSRDHRLRNWRRISQAVPPADAEQAFERPSAISACPAAGAAGPSALRSWRR